MLNATSRSSFLALLTVCGGLAVCAPAHAQYYGRCGVPHYHDTAGHRVDAMGRHIDLYGRPTGPVGVYDNGSVSVPPYLRNPYGYPNANGGYPTYSSFPSTSLMPNSGTSQPFTVNQAPQNVIPGANAPVSGGKIRIMNPVGTGGEVRFNLNERGYSLKEGTTQSIDNDRVWVIHFGSAGTRGDLHYTLSEGLYKFQVDRSGWELLRAADQNEDQNRNNSAPPLSTVPGQVPQPGADTPELPPSPQ